MSKSVNAERKWLSVLVASVPGLAVFLTGLGAPSDSRVLFAVILEITAFGVLALLVLKKDEIANWSVARVGRHVVRSVALGIALLLLYALLHNVIVYPTYYAPGRPQYVLIPIPVSAWVNDDVRYYANCALQTDMSACKQPELTRLSPTDIARAATRFGDAFDVPHAWLWATQLTILAALYAAIIASFLWLFGIAMIRRLDVRQFLASHASFDSTG